MAAGNFWIFSAVVGRNLFECIHELFDSFIWLLIAFFRALGQDGPSEFRNGAKAILVLTLTWSCSATLNQGRTARDAKDGYELRSF